MKRAAIILVLACGLVSPPAGFGADRMNTVLPFSFFRGAIRAAGEPISGSRAGGPSASQSGGAYCVSFDAAADSRYLGSIQSTDLKAWPDISPELPFPDGIRPGTVSMVPESVVQQIQNPRQQNKIPI